MRKVRRKSKPEPTIALINIVFLMLIFFLVAGTLAQPLDRELKLVETADLDASAPPDALVLNADGQASYRGEPIANVSVFLDGLDTDQLARVKVVPDRALDAARRSRDTSTRRVICAPPEPKASSSSPSGHSDDTVIPNPSDEHDRRICSAARSGGLGLAFRARG